MIEPLAIPYEIREPGVQSCPILFNSPHSGRHYPLSFLKMSQLDSHEIRKSEDSYLDEMFNFAPEIGASLMHAFFPRAYLDLNRQAFELDPAMFKETLPDYINTGSHRAKIGLGTIARIISERSEIYEGKISFKEALSRIETLYFPYHEALQQKLNNIYSTFGYVLLIDCHSMPSAPFEEKRSRQSSADIILGNDYNRSCNTSLSDVLEYLLVKTGYRVVRNHPYAGGYITQKYGKAGTHFQAIQIEINRRLYMDEDSLKIHDGFYTLRDDLRTVSEELIKNLGALIRQKPIAAE